MLELSMGTRPSNNPSPRLAYLAYVVREAQNAHLATKSLDEVRSRVLTHVADHNRPAPAKKAPMRASLAFASVALALLALILMRSPNETLTFQVDGKRIDEGSWIAPEGQAPSALQFSDGTQVTVEASSRVHVADVKRSGARVKLERGTLKVAVTHNSDTAWHFIGGPYDVLVTGTKFDMVWDPSTQHLRVAMKEGSVRVTGPDGPRTVVAGQTLDAAAREGTTSVKVESSAAQPNEPSSSPAPSPTASSEPTAPATHPSSAKASPSSDAAQNDEVSWRKLAASGKYRDALEAAEAAGFTSQCETGTASDLLALGDAARYVGNASRANDAYTALRRRFPSSHHASTAAFMLGKLAFDQKGSFGSSVSWFEAYLRERPNGALAREALGRLMEAKSRAGDRAGAQEAARRYLERYPSGPRADLAQRLNAAD